MDGELQNVLMLRRQDDWAFLNESAQKYYHNPIKVLIN
jgi:hypothetical protein